MSDPVYLVSRCSSIEEFVAAFRRYADRLGVFIPVAAPVPVGRKARFAITLKDGGVVIEGDAEVIMSSTRAAGLHGRPGMTLRFASVDADSRAVLDHLEKVRFGAKVTLASNHLVIRPGPAAPSDLGPPPVAKPGTDPAQLLAECVVIGDAGVAVPTAAPPTGSGPRARAPGSVPPPVGAAGSQRFAIPAIVPRTGPIASVPPMSGSGSGPTVVPPSPTGPTGPVSGIAATVSAPATIPPPIAAKPAAKSRPMPPPTPAELDTPTDQDEPPPPAMTRAPARSLPNLPGMQRPTMMGAAVADPRLPGPVSGPHTAVPLSADGVPAIAASASGAVTVAGGAATVPTAVPDTAVPIETPFLRHTTRGVAPPGVHEIEMGPTIPVGRGTPPPPELQPDPEPPPMPMPGAHAVPEPSVLPQRRPQPPKTRTMMGIQAIPREPAVPSSPGIKIPTEVEAAGAAPAPAAVPAPPRAPAVPKPRALTPPPVTPIAPAGPSIEIDPSAFEPTETQAVIDPTSPAAGGNGAADDGEVAVIAQAWPPPDAPPVPAPELLPAPPAWAKAPGQPAPVPGPPVLPSNVRAVTDGDTGFFKETGPQDRISEARIGYVTDSNTGFFQETGAQQAIGYGTEDMTAMVTAPPSKKRLLVIVVSCIAVFVLGFIAILVLGAKRPSSETKTPPKQPAVAKAPVVEGGSGSGSGDVNGSGGGSGSGSAEQAVVPPTPTVGSGSGSAAEPAAGSGSGSGSAAATGSGSGSAPREGDDTAEGDDTPPVADGATKIGTGECKVKVTSSPSGSEVVVAGKTRGRTPLDLAISCAATQIAVRKTHYATFTKTVKPTAKKKSVKVTAKLARVTFTVKVSSIPSGGTVLVNGKKSGKTPTAVKVPGFTGATIMVTKDGFANQSERVTAKQNGTAIRMVLKKK